MHKTASILILALVLPACTTAQIDEATSIARTSIDVICAGYPTADFAFQQLAATGRLKPSTVAAEQAAVGSLAALCADPPKDTKTAIAAASRVYAALLTAAEDARKQTAAK